MPARMIVELPGGHKVFFGGQPAGLAEVGIADDITTATSEKFKAALGSLAGLVAAIEQSIEGMACRPDKIELEFSASLGGNCDLWIVSGEGEAEFKVKLGWSKDPS